MKVAITVTENAENSTVDPRFGRAAGFMVIDTETGRSSFQSNATNASLPQGAGLQAAMRIADEGVKVLITGHVGPKAYSALTQGGISVYYTTARNITDAMHAYTTGALNQATAPAAKGHW